MLELITAPTIYPVEYIQVLHHLKMDAFDEAIDLSSQEYLGRLIAAITKDCEAFTNRAFITQTWKYFLLKWPSQNYIEIPKPPLQGVTHVKYTDNNGTLYEFSTDYYTVDTKSVKGKVVLKPNQSWPSASLYSSNPIEIQFICGYGDAPEDVEPAIRHAILIQIGDLWDNREEYREGNLIRTSLRLLWPYMVFF